MFAEFSTLLLHKHRKINHSALVCVSCSHVLGLNLCILQAACLNVPSIGTWPYCISNTLIHYQKKVFKLLFYLVGANTRQSNALNVTERFSQEKPQVLQVGSN